MDTICGIYKITSPTGKIYIGQSVNIYKTWNDRYKNGYCKSQRLLYNSIKKYKWENHISEVLQVCTDAELNKLELYYSNLFDSTNKNKGLNLRQCGGSRGRHSQETKNRMSISNKKAHSNPETKARMIKISTGRVHSEETKLKMRNSHLGRKHSEESKAKMSAILIGNKRNAGKKLSDKHRAERSIFSTGRKHSDFTKKKLSDMNKGKRHTEETKIKISNSLKNRGK